MTKDKMNPCFILPCYQHSQFIDGVLSGLESFNIPTVIVNDGSDEAHSRKLTAVSEAREWVDLVNHKENQGKGGAVKTALQYAYENGYTHAIQVDSDGQHDLEKIDELLVKARANPDRVISGCPVYDESVPKSRLYGRKLTQFWVVLETISHQIKDSMCGFRVYPVKKAKEIIDRYYLGQKMDFDPEILVKFYWQGTDIDFVPVSVNYPDEGVSHFNMIRDNWLITKMHTRLMIGMLFRFPKLIFRKKKFKNLHWSKVGERGGAFALGSLFFIYKILGYNTLKLLVYPVTLYFYIFARAARGHSKNYFTVYTKYCEQNNMELKKISSFKHILSFAKMAVDKMSVWHNDIPFDRLNINHVNALNSLHDPSQGRVFISSHYGNIEICRAMGRRFPYIKINALMYQKNAKHFFSTLKKLNIESDMNVIFIDKFGVDLAIRLQEKVEKGEWIFILADRESVTGAGNNIICNVLGQAATLPKGPFLLASLLKVPTYVFHCFKFKNKFHFRTKELIYQTDRKVKRTEQLSLMAQNYAEELNQLIVADPLQWYNFFDFWNVNEKHH